MKEGLGKMVKSVEQHFNQVDSVLAVIKGVYDTMSLQQLFQQLPKVQASLPHEMFSVEGSQGSQGIPLNTPFIQSVLDGLMLQYIRQMPSQQSQPLAGK